MDFVAGSHFWVSDNFYNFNLRIESIPNLYRLATPREVWPFLIPLFVLNTQSNQV